MKKIIVCTLILIIIVAPFMAKTVKSSFVKVNPGQRAVKTEWGHIVDSTYVPGLVWTIPFTQSLGNEIRIVDIKPQRYEYTFEVRTKDLQRISLNVALLCQMNDKKVHKLYDKYTGYKEYETKVIKDMLRATTLTLCSFADVWTFMGSKDNLTFDAVKYIVNDQLKKDAIISVSNINILGYKASPEFENLIEETVQTMQGIKLEDYRVQMAEKATLRVIQEATQTYERMAAEIRANGLDIEIKAAALQNNPFVAQYELAKAIQNWNGELNLPQTLTILENANNGTGTTIFPYLPVRLGK